MFYYTAALLLIITPESDVNGRIFNEAFRTQVQDVAIQLEILDPRERRYILNRPEDFGSDLNLVRRRYQELHNAPKVGESFRFPERESINEMLTFNRAYRQYIDTHYSLYPYKYWDGQEIINETDHLYQVWDCVRDARCEYYYVTVRRQALKRLRDQLLDKKDFHSGQLPPFVPFWRFQDLNHAPKRVHADTSKAAPPAVLRKPAETNPR